MLVMWDSKKQTWFNQSLEIIDLNCGFNCMYSNDMSEAFDCGKKLLLFVSTPVLFYL